MVIKGTPASHQERYSSWGKTIVSPIRPEFLNVEAQFCFFLFSLYIFCTSNKRSIVHRKHAFEVPGHFANSHQAYMRGCTTPPTLMLHTFAATAGDIWKSDGCFSVERVRYGDETACNAAYGALQFQSFLHDKHMVEVKIDLLYARVCEREIEDDVEEKHWSRRPKSCISRQRFGVIR